MVEHFYFTFYFPHMVILESQVWPRGKTFVP